MVSETLPPFFNRLAQMVFGIGNGDLATLAVLKDKPPSIGRAGDIILVRDSW